MYNQNSCPCTRQSMQVRNCSESACKAVSPLPFNPVVAMAYVPFQQMGEPYSCEKALCSGTIFPCLDLEFMGCCR